LAIVRAAGHRRRIAGTGREAGALISVRETSKHQPRGSDTVTEQQQSDTEARAAENGQLKTPIEARQGVKTGHVRWMLAISMALGIVVLGGAWALFSGSHSHDPGAANATAAAERQPNT
jgi:hypothetical protein